MSEEIRQTDQRLIHWIGSVLEHSVVFMGPPGKGPADRYVGLYLLDFLSDPPTSSTQRTPLQFSARYLVTVFAPDPATEHEMLSEILFRALEHSDFEVELDPPGHAFWSAFGLVPRPGFRLRVAVRREREARPAKRVRQPIYQFGALATCQGTVLGPGDIPMVGAFVELPGLDRTTYTDATGHFRFEAVPTQTEPQQVRIVAKGTEKRLTVRSGEQKPHLIRIDLTEE